MTLIPHRSRGLRPLGRGNGPTTQKADDDMAFQMVKVYGHLHRTGEIIELGEFAGAFVQSGPDGLAVVVQPGNRQLLTQMTNSDGSHKAWRERQKVGTPLERDGRVFEHFEITTATLS